jgi:hypothetical protein
MLYREKSGSRARIKELMFEIAAKIVYFSDHVDVGFIPGQENERLSENSKYKKQIKI